MELRKVTVAGKDARSQRRKLFVCFGGGDICNVWKWILSEESVCRFISAADWQTCDLIRI